MAVMSWLHSYRNCIEATPARARQLYRWRTRRQGTHAPCPTQPPCWIHSTVCEHGCALWSNFCLPCAAAMGIHARRMILFFFFSKREIPRHTRPESGWQVIHAYHTSSWQQKNPLLRNNSPRPQREQRPPPLHSDSEIILFDILLEEVLHKTRKQFFLGLVKFVEKLYSGQVSFYELSVRSLISFCRHTILSSSYLLQSWFFNCRRNSLTLRKGNLGVRECVWVLGLPLIHWWSWSNFLNSQASFSSYNSFTIPNKCCMKLTYMLLLQSLPMCGS